MLGQFHHFQINVSNLEKSSKFYSGFLQWLGFQRVIDIDQTEAKDITGWRRGRSRIFLVQCRDKFISHEFHRKHVGINHIAFWAPSRKMIDRFYKEYLLPNKIRILYGGPREYSEYIKGYYAVYFEDPDKLKLELMTAPTFSLTYGKRKVHLPRH